MMTCYLCGKDEYCMFRTTRDGLYVFICMTCKRGSLLSKLPCFPLGDGGANPSDLSKYERE